jgi:hypothetical protein
VIGSHRLAAEDVLTANDWSYIQNSRSLLTDCRHSKIVMLSVEA